jgi:hypothetical protein
MILSFLLLCLATWARKGFESRYAPPFGVCYALVGFALLGVLVSLDLTP